MKLRLPLNRCIGPGLVALAAGLIGESAERLAEVRTAPVDSVHRARVALKRARSTLRLLEKAGAAWAIMPRYRLAELGARMSAARENAVATALALTQSRRLRGRASQAHDTAEHFRAVAGVASAKSCPGRPPVSGGGAAADA